MAFVFILSVTLHVVLLVCHATSEKPLPNIVIFLADDLGIADIGPYGNTTLATPHLDSLARDGLKLTHHLAADSVCTPSRSALLTGRFTKRYGMDGGFMRVLVNLASPTGLSATEVTFADLAQSAGYNTALIGKWHLGVYNMFGSPIYHPLNRGFDYFYGLPFSLAPDSGDEGQKIFLLLFPNLTRDLVVSASVILFTLIFLLRVRLIKLRTFVCLVSCVIILYAYIYISVYCLWLSTSVLMKNFDTIEMPARLVGLTERFAREGVEFIQNQTTSGKPFLLFMSWGHTHTFLAPSQKFAGRTRHGRYGDSVEEMDWGIGMILKALDDTKSRDNTLVYFTSDHGGSSFDIGPKGEMDGGYNGIYRGSKGIGGVDGGIRVPGLFRWPGIIHPGSVSDTVTTQLDILPLISAIANTPLPGDREIDGKDIAPVLQGQETQSPYEFVFHYCDGVIVAVRYMPRGETEVWKLVYRAPSHDLNITYTWADIHCTTYVHLRPPFLFNINSDPGENHPLKLDSDPKYQDIVTLIDKATEKHRKSISYVKSSLTFWKLLWYPHLQPCCNFPLCYCMEEKYKTEDIR